MTSLLDSAGLGDSVHTSASAVSGVGAAMRSHRCGWDVVRVVVVDAELDALLLGTAGQLIVVGVRRHLAVLTPVRDGLLRHRDDVIEGGFVVSGHDALLPS